jgi:hypothetical protein
MLANEGMFMLLGMRFMLPLPIFTDAWYKDAEKPHGKHQKVLTCC